MHLRNDHLTDNDGNGLTAQMVIMFLNYIIIIQMQVTLPCISLKNCLYTSKNRLSTVFKLKVDYPEPVHAEQ